MIHKTKNLLLLMRPKHYIKNFLIFVPSFFEGTLFGRHQFVMLIYGFISFCMVCSSIYIINDLRDVDKDKAHAVKCKRPIASGAVTVSEGVVLAAILFVCGFLLLGMATKQFLGGAQFYLLIYFFFNVAYSFGMKNVPILDVIILASGFLLRIMFGAALCNVWVSEWLCLTVMMMSLYMGAGKRKNEIAKEGTGSTRIVLKYYTEHYLEKVMQMCMILGLAFYALWSSGMMGGEMGNTGMKQNLFIWTVPLVFAIIMRYEMLVERDNYADPADVFYSDKAIIALAVIYILSDIFILYGRGN